MVIHGEVDSLSVQLRYLFVCTHIVQVALKRVAINPQTLKIAVVFCDEDKDGAIIGIINNIRTHRHPFSIS